MPQEISLEQLEQDYQDAEIGECLAYQDKPRKRLWIFVNIFTKEVHYEVRVYGEGGGREAFTFIDLTDAIAKYNEF